MSPFSSFPRMPWSVISHGLCYITLLYFVAMDYRLYGRVMGYRLRGVDPREKEYVASPSCSIDPLCTVTVKGLMLDYPNYYILGPTAGFFESLFGLSTRWWLSPNVISACHVSVAIVAGKFISTKSLTKRRLGVLLFQVRSLLDDLDGVVARRRCGNLSGEYSEVGTTGYYVDAFCDGLGTLALLIGIFQYIRTNLPRHGYEKLQTVLPIDSTSVTGGCVVYRKTMRVRSVVWSMFLVAGSLLASSITWNRYLYVYGDLLETDYPRGSPPNLAALHARQTHVFRLGSFWLVALPWRLINPHALTDYLLLAVFVDRLWCYVSKAPWIIFGIVVSFAYVTEFYYHQVLLYIAGASVVYPDDKLYYSDLVINRTSHF